MQNDLLQTRVEVSIAGTVLASFNSLEHSFAIASLQLERCRGSSRWGAETRRANNAVAYQLGQWPPPFCKRSSDNSAEENL
jgi:hypothetical protein